jgi:hypothetical protein
VFGRAGFDRVLVAEWDRVVEGGTGFEAMKDVAWASDLGPLSISLMIVFSQSRRCWLDSFRGLNAGSDQSKGRPGEEEDEARGASAPGVGRRVMVRTAKADEL